MDMKLNLNNIQSKDCRKIYEAIKKQGCNSSILVDIDSYELAQMVKNYINKITDTDFDSIGFILNTCMNESSVDMYIDYPIEDKNEYELFKKTLKEKMGNHIINADNKIGIKTLLRAMFVNALNYEINNSMLTIEYRTDKIDELKSIQLRI